jgi:hypothetical protein
LIVHSNCLVSFFNTGQCACTRYRVVSESVCAGACCSL